MLVVWLLVMCIIAIYAEIIPLPDGIYATKREGVASVKADLELVILITSPPEPSTLLNALSKVRKEAERVKTYSTLRVVDRLQWLNRITQLESLAKSSHASMNVKI